MAEFIFFYGDMLERGTILGRENRAGRRLLHDDHINVAGNATQGRSGRLTFSDAAEPAPSAEAARLNELTEMLLADTILMPPQVSEFLKLFIGGSI